VGRAGCGRGQASGETCDKARGKAGCPGRSTLNEVGTVAVRMPVVARRVHTRGVFFAAGTQEARDE